MKPTILIVTTERWFSTARLAIALCKGGCSVEMVCPPDHPIGKTRAVSRMYDYHGLAPLLSVARAISSCMPDLVVPADDLATQHLHALYRRASRGRTPDEAFCQMIRRSLGAPDSFPVLYRRAAVIDLARQAGIRVPETRVIASAADLRDWITEIGFPFVLKADCTSGGTGVKIVRSSEEAYQAFRKLQSPPGLKDALRQTLKAKDTTLLRPAIFRRGHTLNAQAFVAGRQATSTVVAWEGRVLASLQFEVLHTAYSCGPATVVRLMQNSEMSSAAEKLICRLNLSGFYGFDFVLDGGSEEPYLIEVNARATQGGHLSLGAGRDLAAALIAAIAGVPASQTPKITENQTIAYFPQEWLRDSASPFLQSAYHDVPWDEPEFVRACVKGHAKPPTWDTRRDTVSVLSASSVPRT